MVIKTAEFVISNTDYNKCPKPVLPEYAFVGRSNVGKSSLINALTARHYLAKTSGKPGKTQCINHFLINHNWYLVDLPGYGYAKTSKTKRREFQKILTGYLRNRQNLLYTFVLIDIRHEAQQKDLDFLRWMGENQLPFTIVFTKSEKISNTRAIMLSETYQKTLLKEWQRVPFTFITSAHKKKGLEPIIKFINEVNGKFADYIQSLD